jgi:hypothetical protein
MVGLDDAGANQTTLMPTIQFKIYTTDPTKAIQKTISVTSPILVWKEMQQSFQVSEVTKP